MYSVLILLLILIVLKNFSFIEHFSTKINFLTKEDTISLLTSDSDKYFQSLSPMDLNARKVQNIQEYLEISLESVSDFTDSEKGIIEKNVMFAQEIIKNINSEIVDNQLLLNLPWNFALTIGKDYELGLAHTRNDTIFLTPDIVRKENLYSTLIHEKIHVYQKEYKEKFQKDLLNNGYSIYAQRSTRKDLRSNPDLDEYIWEKNGKIYQDQEGKYEHPNEEIAYTLEKNIL